MEGNKVVVASRTVFMAFLVGGLLSVLGQLFLVIAAALVGPTSPLAVPLALVFMGLFALVTFIPGWYQKLLKVGGFGAIMPFSGLAAACAGAFCEAKAKTGSSGKAAAAAVGLVAYVVGTGVLILAVVAAIVVFAL
ncbi:MAG: SpoVA/SpoVAEb family sporulation membrane protein [Coriobacteriia bacterium]